MIHESYESIPGRYGLAVTRSGDQAVTSWVPVEPGLSNEDGSLRPAAVLMAVDMACGMAAGLGVYPKWTVTADSEVRLVGPCLVGPLRVEARCVRPGRHQSMAEAYAYDHGANDALVAVATANHGVLVPKWDTFMADTPIGVTHKFHRPDSPPTESLESGFGVERRTGPDGTTIVVPLDDRTRNPWGILHGGLTGLMVELAAAAGGIVEPRDFVLRLMRPVREGPAEARVIETVDRDGDRLVRIELHDVGADRLAVIAHVSGHTRGPQPAS